MKIILVIEDDPIVADVVRIFAQKLGYDTLVFRSSNGVIQTLENVDYWAVLCDLSIPGIKTFDIYDMIKARKRSGFNRFVVLTGAIPDHLTKTAMEDRNIPILRKPFTFKEFSDLISELNGAEMPIDD